MTPTPLTEHFSVEELTNTDNAALQETNRILTAEQIGKLRVLAEHCEKMRDLCGGAALRVHSGYRSLALNGATLGSSSTSQHPKCEAVDFDVAGQEVAATFQTLLAAAKAGKFVFGQLILEMANRGYASVQWVHCSVPGSLLVEKVGQVLKMEAAADGVPHYELIEQVTFKA